MTWEEISKELFEEKTEKRFELIWETDEMCNVFDNDLNVNSTISVEDVVDPDELQEEIEEEMNQQAVDEEDLAEDFADAIMNGKITLGLSFAFN